MPPEQSFFNPTIYGKPLFPSNFGSRAIGAITRAITPSAGTPPATMAGVSPIPTGASLSQLRFTGPLIRTGGQQPAALQSVDATLPSGATLTGGVTSIYPPRVPPVAPSPLNFGFNISNTQTPSSKTQIGTNLLTGQVAPLQFAPPASDASLEDARLRATTPARPQAGFAKIADFSQHPLVKEARATGNIAAIQQATAQAAREMDQGISGFQPNVISSISLANLSMLRPNAGFGGTRSPAEQQALLAKMRAQGANIMRNNINSQEQFFAQKRAERSGLAQAEAIARARGATSMDIMRARDTQPSTIAGIQRQFATFQQRLPVEGLAARGVSDFSRNLRISPIKYGALGPSGSDLERLQQQSRRLM